jgi:hypothetical protein
MMGMSRMLGRYGAALAIAMSYGCSDSAAPLQPPIEKDAGGQKYPTLPASCDDMSSVTSTGQGPSTELIHGNHRLRVTNRTVYYHRAAGIHAIDVPGGTGVLQLAYPEATVSSGKRPLEFRDFWLNSTSALGAIGGALYDGALSGGAAALRPGYSAPSYGAAAEDQGYYAVGGDAVFRTVRTDSSTSIERLPVKSGPGAVFLQMRRDKQTPIFIADNFLYYVDWADGESGETASIFMTPLDGAAPFPLARGLQSPHLLGYYDHTLYFQDSSAQLGQLWRVRPVAAAEKLTIPDYAALGILPDDTRLAGLGSSVYVTAHALYQQPDDAGTSLRDVVLRIETGSTNAEVVQCLPNTAGDTGVPPQDYAISNVDLAAGDSAVYLSRVFLDADKATWEERISEVRP